MSCSKNKSKGKEVNHLQTYCISAFVADTQRHVDFYRRSTIFRFSLGKTFLSYSIHRTLLLVFMMNDPFNLFHDVPGPGDGTKDNSENECNEQGMGR